jgi:hypothetical protein
VGGAAAAALTSSLMLERDVARLAERHLAPHFPDLRVVRDLLVRYDGPILRGFCLDRSQLDPAGFDVVVFAQPLIVPAEEISLGVAVDLAHCVFDPDREDELMGAVATAAVVRGSRFVAEFSDALSFAESVTTERFRDVDGRRVREARAYCRAYAGDLDAARAEIAALRPELEAASATSWVRDIAVRVHAFERALDVSPAEVRRLLDGWAERTRSALALPVLSS